MSETEALQKRFEAALMPNYGVPPLAISRGQGCRVWDADGREYLDLIAGIAVSSLGHAHPAIVEAVSRQVAQVAHTSNLFLHEREIELAERILYLLGGTTPPDPPALSSGGTHPPGPPLGETHPPRPPLGGAARPPIPPRGGRVFFASSGAEANEAAIKLV
ncbi:MAG TPA: aminotransferase class III-fold pyridoxal phosphate-dependent enzyme, partial [Streptosporangiaceae bacterium]|nr:aminotransferase class III-fold pyridoxal phosphate-dependent enzyme [Streptosporangiaceae bacterium]